MIDNYKFGEFIIKGKKYKSNVALINDQAKPARYLENHELRLDDFLELVNASPSTIIIGTGASGVVKVPQEIIDYIEKRKIKLIIAKTSDACKKYNELIKQGKNIAAFMHNTCWTSLDQLGEAAC